MKQWQKWGLLGSLALVTVTTILVCITVRRAIAHIFPQDDFLSQIRRKGGV